MAVILTGTGAGVQGLFNRLGAIGHLINLVNTFRGTNSSGNLPFEVEDAVELFDGASTTIRDAAVDGLLAALTSIQAGMARLPTACRQAAHNTLVEMFDADAPLTKRDVAAALARLRTQMLTAVTTFVDANTLGASVTSTGNDGNGAVVTSTKAGDGTPLENLLAEDLSITVTAAGTAGSETLLVKGEEAVNDRLSHRWPAGSGASRSYTAVDAATSGSKLTNGTFDAFSPANTPTGWTIEVGSAGTTILEEATIVYKGAKALELDGNGAELTQIWQALTVSGLRSKTPYAVNFWGKVDVAPAAGVLTVDLFDGTSVINDDAGVANSFTVDLTALGTTYVAKSGVFRLPEPLPAIVRLRVRLSTALSAGSSLFIDHLALAQMQQPSTTLPGAVPFIAFFSGSVNWNKDDGAGARVFKIAATNGGESDWQKMFARLFETPKTGYTLPTVGTTLIADALIG